MVRETRCSWTFSQLIEWVELTVNNSGFHANSSSLLRHKLYAFHSCSNKTASFHVVKARRRVQLFIAYFWINKALWHLSVYIFFNDWSQSRSTSLQPSMIHNVFLDKIRQKLYKCAHFKSTTRRSWFIQINKIIQLALSSKQNIIRFQYVD